MSDGGARNERNGVRPRFIAKASSLAKPASLALVSFVVLATLAMIATGAPAVKPPAARAITSTQLWAAPTSDVFAHVARRPTTATKAFTDGWPVLVDADQPWEPDPEAPRVPSSCLEIGDHACVACFVKAYKDLDFVHATLERLRAIYGATKRMSDQAIATGDRLAPTLPGGQDEWQRQRSGIVQSIVDLAKTYRSKYSDLMKTLATAVAEIDRCERDIHGEADWYEHHGKSLTLWFDTRYRLSE